MTTPVKKFNIVFAAKSDIGLVRTENQDSFGIFPEENSTSDFSKGQLFIVADGMGGHKGGKEASSLAVKVVGEEFFKSAFEEGVALREAIEKANSTIFNKTGKKYEFSRMGTTCSALAIIDEKVVIGHVGDSRIYKIENNSMSRLTNDHTKVEEMLREGILTPEEAKNYPSKSVLARALGIDEAVKVDINNDLKLKRGQSYILCSDGLAKVTKGEILSIVQNSSPSDACNRLVDVANERGGKDNVTVIIVKIDPGRTVNIPPAEPAKKKHIKPRVRSFDKKRNGWLKVIIVFLIIIVLLIIQYKDSIFPPSETRTIKQQVMNQVGKPGTNGKPAIDLDYADKKLLEEADRLLKQYDYDNAYLIYKSLLSNQSFQQAAQKGLNEIAAAYLTMGNNYVNDKNFSAALRYYKKAKDIEPDNENIKSLIKLCMDQIDNKEPAPEPQPVKKTQQIKTESSSQFTVSGFDNRGWLYPGMNKSECSVSGTEIDFNNALSERFILYNKDLFDVEISAGVQTDNANSVAGLIIGYVSPLDYYVFKCRDGGNYILQRTKGNEIKNLIEIKPKDSSNPEFRKMKIIYSNNLIRIYDQNGLISSYKSIWGIFGKAGIYVDKGTSAKIKDISVSGSTDIE